MTRPTYVVTDGAIKLEIIWMGNYDIIFQGSAAATLALKVEMALSRKLMRLDFEPPNGFEAPRLEAGLRAEFSDWAWEVLPEKPPRPGAFAWRAEGPELSHFEVWGGFRLKGPDIVSVHLCVPLEMIPAFERRLKHGYTVDEPAMLEVALCRRLIALFAAQGCRQMPYFRG